MFFAKTLQIFSNLFVRDRKNSCGQEGGIPVGTLAIGSAGAKNAALLAAAILALSDEKIRKNLQAFRKKQTDAVLAAKLPR